MLPQISKDLKYKNKYLPAFGEIKSYTDKFQKCNNNRQKLSKYRKKKKCNKKIENH